MASRKDEQRYYPMLRMNQWFAVSSVLFLAALLWVLVDDYAREWKSYQRGFRALEVEKTRALLSEEIDTLAVDEEFAKLQEELTQVREEFATKAPELKALEDRRGALQSTLSKNTKEYEFAKADYDAQRYAYEAAVAEHSPEKERLSRELDVLKVNKDELRQQVEQGQQDLDEQIGAIVSFEPRLEELVERDSVLAKRRAVLERKLGAVDSKAMSLSEKLGNLVRDFPLLDLSSPYYKIDQVVVSGLTENVNFARVPRVDRCTTCHQGMVAPGFKGEEQPFGSHPSLELFLSDDSPHPLEDFGCTSCHAGRGRGTDFESAAHTPSNAEQREEWKDRYGWQPMTHWEELMHPLQYTEAGCLKCHMDETTVDRADELSLGLQLIEKAACYGCHVIEKFAGRPKTGPSLRSLGAKTSREWLYNWIDNPRGFRPDTWMPHFYNLSNSSDPESMERSEQEIHAIVEFLLDASEEQPLSEVPPGGNAERGRVLFGAVGCTGCHRDRGQDEDPAGETELNSLHREFGPRLTGLGTKTTKRWTFNWIKDPAQFGAQKRMPNMGLTDQEAADIAEYLVQDRRDGFVSQALAVDNSPGGALDAIVLEYLMQAQYESAARGELEGMNTPSKLLYAGEKLVRHFGCFACHDIPGFEKELPIGVALDEVGSKNIHQFDFGFLHGIEHTRYAWYGQKLKDPRIFDQSRVKAPREKLRMPDFAFSSTEIEAIVTALAGFVKEDPKNQLKVPHTQARLFAEEGEALLQQYNCRGCHIISEVGGDIEPAIGRWLMDYKEFTKRDARDMAFEYSPPSLMGEGKKVQSEWLFKFLGRPDPIRPWLDVRMPTFGLDEAERNTLTKYFGSLDGQEAPFVAEIDPPLSGDWYEAGKALFALFDCGKCHIQGDTMPSGESNSWAPDFERVRGRLKPEWVLEWLKDPQELQRGTKMPTSFDLENFEESGPENILDGDESEQIRALRDYVFTIGQVAGEPVTITADGGGVPTASPSSSAATR